jgi:hypothetical protein
MDRDLGTPKTESRKPIDMCHDGIWVQSVLPLKQTRRGLRGDDSKYGLVQSAHYKDATFNKEFYR